ncbi:MAG: chromosomal replication initiator protein DnaA [Clostridia bacterium]|nr:chromosomal replication initiator protein DnaA [Clostridia bacterium]
MDSVQLQFTWEKTLEKMAEKYSSVIMNCFFKDTQLVLLTEKMAVVQNHSDALRNALAASYVDDVTEYLSDTIGRDVRVYFESDEKKPVDLSRYMLGGSTPIYTEGGKDDEPDFIEPGSERFGNFYDSRYTFDNFVVGSSNKFAHAAAEAVATMGVAAAYNPLFIYGDSGLGKTHLLYAIINETIKRDPSAKIVYARADVFTNEIISAIRLSTQEQFREKYRKADILLIDDVQFLAGKVSTQEEFFHTFNALFEADKQIVLTSDRPARDIQPLDERLRTRFEWGLQADVTAPDYELRIAIMQNKAKTYHAQFPQEVFEFLAQHLTSNVRQMEGSIKKIAAQSFLNSIPVTVELAAKCISDVVSQTQPASVIAEKVISTVAKKYGLNEEDITGKKRTQNISRPRNIAIYIIRNITDMPLKRIGEIFDRNHTTIMNSIDVVENSIKTESLLELEIQELIKEIKE